MAAREETVCGTVGGHSLITFILGSEGVAKRYPTLCKVFVKTVRFVEVLASQVKLLNQEVVSALKKEYVRNSGR